MARRVMNRKELRANYDAAERRKGETDEAEDEEVEEEADEEAEEEGEEEGEAEDEAGEEAGDDEEADEDAPRKKKKPAKVAKPKPKAKPRTRTVKIVRMRVVWGVFNNSNQRIATYDYPKRADAEAHVAKLMADKKTTHFIQPVKEPIEEKKEE